MRHQYLRLAVPLLVAASCGSFVVYAAYDSPLDMMVAPSPPLQMLMFGRTALFTIVAIGSALLLAYAMYTDVRLKHLLAASLLVLIVALAGTIGTMRIQNYLQPPPCCDLHDHQWGYPYGWISCYREAFCGGYSVAHYYWPALVADLVFWANVAVCAVGILGNLPQWLRGTHPMQRAT
jgi:hypothetical protein